MRTNHKLLDLFSGIGGFSLGAERNGIETIGFVEKDKFCQKVLKKHWSDVPIIDDIRKVNGKDFGAATIISGGFPCQPFSTAGKRRGTDDDRYLWDEMLRVISSCKPTWVIGENVEGLINIQEGMVLRSVQDDLEREGFQVQCLVIPASGIGAWHQRNRVWIIAHYDSNRKSRCSQYVQERSGELGESHVSKENGNVSNTQHQRWSDQSIRGHRELGEKSREKEKRGNQSALRSTTRSSERGTDEDVSNTKSVNSYERKHECIKKNEIQGQVGGESRTYNVSNTDSKRLEMRYKENSTLHRKDKRGYSSKFSSEREKESWWQTQSKLCGVPNGISYELHSDRANRIKALGNSIVPQIAEQIFRSIIDAE